MPASADKRDQFTIPLKCRCGQAGAAVWEDNSGSNAVGPTRYLVSLSDGFHELIRKDHRSIDLVCAICGAVQPDPLDQKPSS